VSAVDVDDVQCLHVSDLQACSVSLVAKTKDAEKMVFPAAIRGKSQRWVALSCDAHLVSSGQDRIRQPCVQSSYWDQTRANIFFNVHHFARETPKYVYEFPLSSILIHIYCHIYMYVMCCVLYLYPLFVCFLLLLQI